MKIPDNVRRDYQAFFSYFPPSQRNFAFSRMFWAMHDGYSEPHQVVNRALKASAYYARSHNPSTSEPARTLLSLSKLDFEALLAGARWALWWNSLPLDERVRVLREEVEWKGEHTRPGQRIEIG